MPVTPKRVGGVVYSAIMFVVVSVLSGVLIAGLLIPFAGMAGMTSKAASEELEKIPVELETPLPAERSEVRLGNGELLTYFYDENRVNVPLSEIAPIMQQAQIAIEDHRFYEHGAMDPMGTLRAFVQNSAGGETQGASSITQQYVKMVQIERAALAGDERGVRKAQEQTISRKIQELRYAIALEKKLSKDEILERYLNIAYFGNGAYGVEAAAQYYFDTSAAKLNLPQAAMLAGLVQNPHQVNPIADEEAAIDRRDTVINRMAQLNIISTEQAKEAKETKFDEDKVKQTKNGCEVSKYPFLCDYVRKSLLQMPELGKTEDARRHMLNRGGLTIQTKIDTETQDAAQKALSDVVSPTDPVISVINIVEPGTGLILAMAQSKPVMGDDSEKGETYWNYSAPRELGGAEGFQAGSTFKAFTLAAALSEGVQIDQVYNAQSRMDFSNRTWNSCDGPFSLTEKWQVSNSTGVNGRMDMSRAIEWSVNTYFVQLENRAGLCNVVKMAEKAGVKLTTKGETFEDLSYRPSFTLGSIEVAPLSMATAYATFAARGIHCDPHMVESVTTPDGEDIKIPDGNCERVMPEKVADGVNKLLSGVMNATGSRAVIPGGYPQAGKTGTTEEGQAVWFAGYTPEVAGIAMISADKTKEPFKKDKNGNADRRGLKWLQLETGVVLEGSGGGDPGMKLYKPAMEAALEGRPKTKFVEPPEVIVKPKQVEIPSTSGRSPAAIEAELWRLHFNVQRSEVYSETVPEDTFMGLSPSPGTKVDEGSTVYMIYSAGRDPKIVEEEKKAEEKKKEEERKRKEREREKEEEQKQQQQQQQEQEEEPNQNNNGNRNNRDDDDG